MTKPPDSRWRSFPPGTVLQLPSGGTARVVQNTSTVCTVRTAKGIVEIRWADVFGKEKR